MNIYMFQGDSGNGRLTIPYTGHDGLLLVSTLDGSMHAMNQRTGQTIWTLKEGKESVLMGAGGGSVL